MSGVKGDPCGNRKARAPRPAYRGAKTAPRAVFRAREIPRGRKLMWPGWLVGARVAGVSTAAFGSVRAGHARPLPGGEKGRVSGRGKVRRRGQDPSLRMEDSMAADAKRAGRACPAPTGWLKESSRQQAGIPPALRRHLPLTREAGRFLLRISRKPSPLPLHNFRVSLIIYCKCTIRRGVPRCRQNHKNKCWESWEGWDPRPAAICIRC